jgi:hypothetical protein
MVGAAGVVISASSAFTRVVATAKLKNKNIENFLILIIAL